MKKSIDVRRDITPDFSGRPRINDGRDFCRDMIREVILKHKLQYLDSGKITTFEQRTIGDELDILFVLIPGKARDIDPYPDEVDFRKCLYISGGVEWQGITEGCPEAKIRYFCGPIENYATEEYSSSIPAHSFTLTIGREFPVFQTLSRYPTLSRTHARISIMPVGELYKVTIADGSEERPSSNGSTILIPHTREPRRSGTRMKAV